MKNINMLDPATRFSNEKHCRMSRSKHGTNSGTSTAIITDRQAFETIAATRKTDLLSQDTQEEDLQGDF